MVSPINITLIIDKTGTIFSLIVLFIASNVLTFSKIYIQDDKFVNRFT
jgi:NADH:ubiquinone oxidoreductase subunit 5 (subunit L)/multisubunit Na+/H+ antiporter MnhA subunit